jgi:hypothetical protein
MAWVNFRDVQDRFTHIDAELVSAKAQFGEGEGDVAITVRFYPWWEHPLFLAAHEAGKPWGFQDTDEGARDVTVKAVGPLAVSFVSGSTVIDWAFSTDHPALWEFSGEAGIFVNGPFDVGELTARLMARKMPFVESHHLCRYLDPGWPRAPSRGVHLPPQLHRPVLEELEAMGVPVYVPRPAGDPPALVLFLLDGKDYVVAEDFMIDVPEFEHQPRWFQPVPPGAG